MFGDIFGDNLIFVNGCKQLFFLTPLKKAATKKACTLAMDLFYELFSIVHGNCV